MIDETDLKILDELRKEGRATFSDIADTLGLATSTVTARFQKLQERGVLTGFKPEIDYEELGFDLTAMIAVTAEAEKIEDTAEKLMDHERVISFFEVTGTTDMIVISRFIDREDMNAFLKEIQQTDGVRSTETNVILTPPTIDDNIDLRSLQGRDRSKLDL
jgi:DNA-binding Lrp family transcriptional regulator